MHVTNGQRIVSLHFDDPHRAMRETLAQGFGQFPMKAAILPTVPEANRDADFLDRKTPWSRVNLGVDHQTIGRGAPGLALTLEAGFEGGDIAHHVCVAGLEKLEEQRPETNRNPQGKKRPHGVKGIAEKLAMPRVEESSQR